MVNKMVWLVDCGSKEAYPMMKGIRQAGVYCALGRPTDPTIPQGTAGVILIGQDGPETQEAISRFLSSGLPLLCFGGTSAALVRACGGMVHGVAMESALKDVRFSQLGVFAGVEGGLRMVESAQYLTLPQGFRTLSGLEGVILAFDDGEGRRTGMQFNPEQHDVDINTMIENFLWKTLKLTPTFEMESYIQTAVEAIQAKVGEDRALCVLSGGVDSAVTACLGQRALGEKLHCLMVDTGLMRQGEPERVCEEFTRILNLPIRRVNAQGRMLEALRGVCAPARKREVVSQLIGQRITEEAGRLGGRVVLLQATNYLEILQGAERPQAMDQESIAPIQALLKDEVRDLAGLLGLPEHIVYRPHYPSAGIAMRCMGEANPQRLAILRQADAILEAALQEAGQVKTETQFFAVLTDMQAELEADGPRYMVAVRAVNSRSAGRANALRLPYDLMERLSGQLLSQLPDVFRVVYDLTPCPPGKVEWE